MKKKLKVNVHDMSGEKEKKQENIIHPLKTADLLRRIHEMEANLFELQKQNEKLEQARAEAEEAYRQYTDLYDFAPVGYFTLGRDGAVHRANLPGAKLLGVDGAQLVNQQLSVFVSEESLPIFNAFFEKLISGTGREISELKFLNDADKPLWVRIDATCFEGGEECRAVLMDISKRKHAEQVARENQELLALFMNHSPIYAFIKEVSPTESRVVQASNNYQEMIGISGSEMVGKTMQELFPPELAANITADDWNVIATGQVLKVDEYLNGRHYSSIKFPLVVGGRTLLAGYSIDITERKQAEKALQESEQRFRSMIQEVQTIAVQGYGMDGTTQYWNTASEKLYGYSSEEALGKSLLELIIPPEMRSDVWQAIQQMAKTGQPIPAAELSLMRKDGSLVTVYSSHAVVSIPGLPTELFCLDVDLTERKRTASLMNARVRISEYADTHTLDELLQKALDEAEALTDSRIGFAHFLKEDQRTLHLQMWSTNTLAHMCTAEGKGSHYPVEQAGVWAECISTREPVIHNDYASLSPSRRKGLPEGHAPIVRELVVPILRNDLVVMIMGVGNKPYEYDENDVEALSQLAGSVWDIVQRKQAEEALKTSERKYRLLHESMIDGFVSADMEGNFLDCNEIYRNMLGYSVAELAQLTYKDITPEKWRAIEAGIVENQIIKRGYSDIYEKEYIRKDGTIFPVELHTVLLRDVDGEPAGMWAIVRDVTERKQAEEALRESELFIKNVLNSITAHIAVLDGQGKIVTVNEAWKQFARENGNTDPESFIGTNYFMACEAAIQLGDEIALQVDHAIHAVMNGLQDEFSIEYPCHSPTQQRWFILTVVPQQKSRQGVIVIHQDITERKQAEQMLKKSTSSCRPLLSERRNWPAPIR